jgi:hypothetical protein
MFAKWSVFQASAKATSNTMGAVNLISDYDNTLALGGLAADARCWK